MFYRCILNLLLDIKLIQSVKEAMIAKQSKTKESLPIPFSISTINLKQV